MKNHERNSDNNATLTLSLPLVNQWQKDYKASSASLNFFAEINWSKIKEASARISRRYSFDDNGGGYQGL